MPRRLETDDLKVVRFRIRRIRRMAIEACRQFTRLPVDHPNAGEIARMNRVCRSVIEVTRPSVVAKATFPECVAVLAFTLADYWRASQTELIGKMRNTIYGST